MMHLKEIKQDEGHSCKLREFWPCQTLKYMSKDCRGQGCQWSLTEQGRKRKKDNPSIEFL